MSEKRYNTHMTRTPHKNFFARKNQADTLAAFDRRQATIRERRKIIQSIPKPMPNPAADERFKRIAAKCDLNILRALLGEHELKRLGLIT